jgi:predicted nucleic acid-binding protein
VRIALDTNVIAYAEGVRRTAEDDIKHRAALQLIANMAEQDMSVSLQALAELHRVLTGKGGLSPSEASERVRLWASRAEVVETDSAVFQHALDLTSAHRLQIFDAVILAAAERSGCELLVTEDLHEGFVWRGVTVSSPFSPTPDPRLSRLLSGQS